MMASTIYSRADKQLIASKIKVCVYIIYVGALNTHTCMYI